MNWRTQHGTVLTLESKHKDTKSLSPKLRPLNTDIKHINSYISAKYLGKDYNTSHGPSSKGGHPAPPSKSNQNAKPTGNM